MKRLRPVIIVFGINLLWLLLSIVAGRINPHVKYTLTENMRLNAITGYTVAHFADSICEVSFVAIFFNLGIGPLLLLLSLKYRRLEKYGWVFLLWAIISVVLLTVAGKYTPDFYL